MRYLRIFLLHFQNVFESRLRVFVWFLIPFIEASIFLLFWKGPLANNAITAGWNYADIASYYLFLIIISSVIVCHIDENVSKEDIKDGKLVNYLTRPLLYFLMKFFEEFPWRVLQGVYALLFSAIVFLFIPSLFVSVRTIEETLLSIVIIICALILSFLYKMVIGFAAFFLIDTTGLYELLEIFSAMLGGLILPLALMPDWLSRIAALFPFAYITYFPIVAFQGKLSSVEMLQTISIQVLWIGIMSAFYLLLWKAGIKRFNTVGR